MNMKHEVLNNKIKKTKMSSLGLNSYLKPNELYLVTDFEHKKLITSFAENKFIIDYFSIILPDKLSAGFKNIMKKCDCADCEIDNLYECCNIDDVEHEEHFMEVRLSKTMCAGQIDFIYENIIREYLSGYKNKSSCLYAEYENVGKKIKFHLFLSPYMYEYINNGFENFCPLDYPEEIENAICWFISTHK